jgi:hypothetical protein
MKERIRLRIPTKLAVIAAAIAVAVPVGIAQATHETGKAGAPGQVCKPLKQSQKSQLKAFRDETPEHTNAEVKAFRKTQHAAYKGCIKGAAEARTDH